MWKSMNFKVTIGLSHYMDILWDANLPQATTMQYYTLSTQFRGYGEALYIW